MLKEVNIPSKYFFDPEKAIYRECVIGDYLTYNLCVEQIVYINKEGLKVVNVYGHNSLACFGSEYIAKSRFSNLEEIKEYQENYTNTLNNKNIPSIGSVCIMWDNDPKEAIVAILKDFDGHLFTSNETLREDSEKYDLVYENAKEISSLQEYIDFIS